jgi:hypothetical protein
MWFHWRAGGACSKTDGPAPSAEKVSADAAFQKKLQEQLLDAKPGSVIEIPAGTYHLTSGLTLRGDGVTIRGAGMEKTILSFKARSPARKACWSMATASPSKTSPSKIPRATA